MEVDSRTVTVRTAIGLGRANHHQATPASKSTPTTTSMVLLENCRRGAAVRSMRSPASEGRSSLMRQGYAYTNSTTNDAQARSIYW